MVDDCFTNINYNYKPTNISGDITAATYHEGVWLCVVSPPSWRQRTCSHRGWPSADSCWWNPDDDKGDSIDRDWITKDCGLSLQKGIWYINIYIYINRQKLEIEPRKCWLNTHDTPPLVVFLVARCITAWRNFALANCEVRINTPKSDWWPSYWAEQ